MARYPLTPGQAISSLKKKNQRKITFLKKKLIPEISILVFIIFFNVSFTL